MARLRTFIAVDTGKPIRDRCVALQDSLARAGTDVKWVETENLHVTLLFLGEVEDRGVPALCRAVAEVCAAHAGFRMSIEGVGCFPNPRRPRVVWVGVGAGNAELIALHEALEPPLLALGCYRREDRQYTPHITLGRVRGDRSSDALATALAHKARWQAGVTEVREVRVLSSELTPRGPIYATLSRAKLAGRGQQTDEEE
jgi:RNA 2',3'-cyclic 3'-phosphodiesterase